ncbi:hypothetical protein HDV00_006861 [Rhizophlyctis rosea]|nr:hypothetical protein HDV00_006861 [Rhizophlyctis rosea]
MDNPMPSCALAELSQSAVHLKHLVARLPSHDQQQQETLGTTPAFAHTLEFLDLSYCAYETVGFKGGEEAAREEATGEKGARGEIARVISQTFSACRNLTTIILDNSSTLLDDDISVLAKRCTKLRNITITNCRLITEMSLVHILSESKSIEDIELANCMRIAKWNKALPVTAVDNVVKRIKLEDCDFPGEVILSACRHLQKLQLECCAGIPSCTTSLLCISPTLQELDLTDSVGVTFSIVDLLDPAHFRNLKKLNLGGCTLARVDKNDVSPEARKEDSTERSRSIKINRRAKPFEGFHALAYPNSAVGAAHTSTGQSSSTNTDIIPLPASSSSSSTRSRRPTPPSKRPKLISSYHPLHESIQSLYFDFCQSLNDRTLRFIAGRCRNLRKVVLEECMQISDAGVAILTRLNPSLTHLNLERTLCGAPTLASLSTNCPNLHALNISFSRSLTTPSITTLLQSCTRLYSLEIAYCVNLGDDVIETIKEYGRGLRQVSVQGCGISDEVLGAFVKEKGKIRCVYVGVGRGLLVGSGSICLSRRGGEVLWWV